MANNPPMIRDVHFEQQPDRLKIVMPVKRNWPYTIIYSVLVVIWIAMLAGGLIYTVRTAFSGERYALVFTIMLIVGLLILYRFGRFLWRQWAFWAANREIMFINESELILRRPISIWGNTDAYDMEHVGAFYVDSEENTPGFEYGFRRVQFGESLAGTSAAELVSYLNQRFEKVSGLGSFA